MWHKERCNTKTTIPANAAIRACLKKQTNFYPGRTVNRKADY